MAASDIVQSGSSSQASASDAAAAGTHGEAAFDEAITTARGEAQASEEAAGASQASSPAAPEIERNFWNTTFDLLGLGGGIAEGVAGGTMLEAGAIATAAGLWPVGVPLLLLGGATFAHGVDTAGTAGNRLLTGLDIDTATAQALQSAGLDRQTAQLADGGIGLVLSAGTLAASKAGLLEAALNSPAAARLRAAQEAEAAVAAGVEDTGWIGIARQREGNHMKVGIRQPGEADMQWSDLINPPPRTNPIELRAIPEPRPGDYEVALIPISGENAASAAARVAEAMQAQAVNGTNAYRYGQSDCLEYVGDILRAAGIETPATSNAAGLLGRVESEALPLLDEADEFFRQAADEVPGSDMEAYLRGLGEDVANEAFDTIEEYTAQRGGDIWQAANQQGEALHAQRESLRAPLEAAEDAFDAAAEAAEAAEAANARRAAVVDALALGSGAAEGVRAVPNVPTGEPSVEPVSEAPLAGTNVSPAAPAPNPAPEPALAPTAEPEPQAPTQTAPAPGRPAAPAPAPQPQPEGGEATDLGEPFVGDIIKMSENEMREWTPEDSRPEDPDNSDEDDDAGAPEPAADSGGGANRPADGGPVFDVGNYTPSLGSYTSNTAGAIRPAEGGPVFEVDGYSANLGAYTSNTAGAIRPADGGPVFDVDLNGYSPSLGSYTSNRDGAIRPVPDEVADPAPTGGTLVSPLGGDPTIALDTEAVTASLGRFGLG